MKIPDNFMDEVSAGTACNHASIVEFTLSRAIYNEMEEGIGGDEQ